MKIEKNPMMDWLLVLGLLAGAGAGIYWYYFRKEHGLKVVTNPATNATGTAPVLHGTVGELGDNTSVKVGFDWGTTDTSQKDAVFTTVYQTVEVTAKNTKFQVALANVAKGTYHFRARAEGIGGYVPDVELLPDIQFGVDRTFVAGEEPTTQFAVVTNAATPGEASAILSGRLTGLGANAGATLSFEWGPSANLGNAIAGTPAQASVAPADFTAALTGLLKGTTYYFKAKAVSGGATVYGNPVPFTTTGVALSGKIDGVTLTLRPTSLNLGNTIYGDIHWHNGCDHAVAPSYKFFVQNAYEDGKGTGGWLNPGLVQEISIPSDASYTSTVENMLVTSGNGFKANQWVNVKLDIYYPGNTTPNPVVTLLKAYKIGAVVVPTPVANFTASPVYGNVPLTVQFTNTSTGDIDSYMWYFGDGETSTAASPTHVYQVGGIRNVVLTVTGPGGSSSADMYIHPMSVDPTIATGGAYAITSVSAIICATLNSMGSYSSLQVGFQYGTTTSYGNASTVTTTSPGTFDLPISGLAPNTLYHYQVWVGTPGTYLDWGSDQTFTTLPGAVPIPGGISLVSGWNNNVAYGGTTASVVTAIASIKSLVVRIWLLRGGVWLLWDPADLAGSTLTTIYKNELLDIDVSAACTWTW